MQSSSNDGMETIRAQEHVSAIFAAIGEANLDARIILIEIHASGAAVNTFGLDQPRKLVQQFSSMDANVHGGSRLPLQPGQRHCSQYIASPSAHFHLGY